VGPGTRGRAKGGRREEERNAWNRAYQAMQALSERRRPSASRYSEERGREICGMAKLVYGLSQSLDGYVDHMKLGPPAPAAFRHFVELVRGLSGAIYGRRMYEIMRYWDEDLPDWDADDREFAAAWRSQPKWVVSRSLKSVGPNATLIADDFEKVIR